MGHFCDEGVFGNPGLGADKACYCKPRVPPSSAKPKPNIPWAQAPRAFESDWMKLDGTRSMSQQDTQYWDAWKIRTTVQKNKARTKQLWQTTLRKPITLWDATKRCDNS